MEKIHISYSCYNNNNNYNNSYFYCTSHPDLHFLLWISLCSRRLPPLPLCLADIWRAGWDCVAVTCCRLSEVNCGWLYVGSERRLAADPKCELTAGKFEPTTSIPCDDFTVIFIFPFIDSSIMNKRRQCHIRGKIKSKERMKDDKSIKINK